jgi:hypothetical protein
MAPQRVIMLMVSETHIAIGTLRSMTTGVTFQNWRKSSSILKKNNLLPLLQGFFDSIEKSFREMTSHLLFSL